MGKPDMWQELLTTVSEDDGLPCRDCGRWTEDKLWFWHRYLSITTNAMVGNPNWKSGLVYVDLFAGPGVCRMRETGQRIPGSPLIAAHAPKPFEKILMVELDEINADACNERMRRSPAADRYRVFQGDCNELIKDVTREIPRGALTLAFIDPEGLHIHFETLKELASDRRVDFLLLFADAIDVVRNVDQYEKESDSTLDKMLGSDSEWRDDWAQLQNRSGAHVRSLFPKIYQRQIKKHLKYSGFRQKIIKGPQGPLYTLIYASMHERGLEFWDKITKKDRTGQGKSVV